MQKILIFFCMDNQVCLEDEIISKDLDQIRNLFDEIENKTNFVDILRKYKFC